MTTTRWLRRLYASFPALLALWPSITAAQLSSTVAVGVRVVDSTGAPIRDADVSILRDVSTVLAQGTTNSGGRVRLSLTRAEGTFQLRVRKIGFQRGYRFFSLGAGDSVAIDMRLERSVVLLEPVNVRAAEDLKRKSYHLDAEDIENSPRTLIDGTDIFKLRPDMMTSRGGAKACEVLYTDRDGWIENVWVNGQRVVMPIVDSQFVAGRKPALGIVKPPPRPNPRITPLRVPKPPPSPWTVFTHVDTVLSILRSIKPQHIAEVTYHDCFDTSINATHSDMSMFIVLKPGIAYRNGVGSYVVADSASRLAASDLDSLPRFRFRLLGAFDQETGDPLADVDVIDRVSGTRATTTSTGTVSLFYIPEGQRPVRLHRDGYRDTTFTIRISAADTLPLTIVLSRQSRPLFRLLDRR